MTGTNDKKYLCKLVCVDEPEKVIKAALLTEQERNRKNTDLMFDYLELMDRRTSTRLVWYQDYEIINRGGEDGCIEK